ncbi:hypothetical protein IFT48_04580 [Pseudomonas fluorescens]|uniref:hypothetical protein n=1 Tax=Pseudomonas TaxID=286 RepID=UPI000F022B6A|nr:MULTISPECIES: hypothetical protein [Pseudomonas]MBD8089249.1 hypothetical protein [Pseudomonas fluorescens]MBD8615324.1 hypothetical protein [Pseudomonas putida]MBD8682022.1 hypothetical protein [Pseudomonas sp. CFBP 13719]
MNITTSLWNLFKFVYLPIGLYFGMLYESTGLIDLSYMIANSVASFMPFDVFGGGSAMTLIHILSAPSALIAWMVPEGSSIVFLLPAAILGQYGIVVFLIAVCWMLAPPRFMQPKRVYE